jgi:tetratricopeptide (TPR) repeat protein
MNLAFLKTAAAVVFLGSVMIAPTDAAPTLRTIGKRLGATAKESLEMDAVLPSQKPFVLDLVHCELPEEFIAGLKDGLTDGIANVSARIADGRRRSATYSDLRMLVSAAGTPTNTWISLRLFSVANSREIWWKHLSSNGNDLPIFANNESSFRWLGSFGVHAGIELMSLPEIQKETNRTVMVDAPFFGQEFWTLELVTGLRRFGANGIIFSVKTEAPPPKPLPARYILRVKHDALNSYELCTLQLIDVTSREVVWETSAENSGVKDPLNTAEELVKLASALLVYGSPKPALIWTTRAIELEPQHWEAYLVAAVAQSRLGAQGTANELLKTASRFAPSDKQEVIQRLAASINDPGQTQTRSPLPKEESPEDFIAAADLAVRRSEFKKAAQLYEKVWDENPYLAEIGLRSAVLYSSKLSEFSKAGRILDRLQSTNNEKVREEAKALRDSISGKIIDDAFEKINRGLGLVKQGNASEGISLLTDAAHATTTSFGAVALARGYAASGNLAETISALRLAAAKGLVYNPRKERYNGSANDEHFVDYEEFFSWEGRADFIEFIENTFGSACASRAKENSSNLSNLSGTWRVARYHGNFHLENSGSGFFDVVQNGDKVEIRFRDDWHDWHIKKGDLVFTGKRDHSKLEGTLFKKLKPTRLSDEDLDALRHKRIKAVIEHGYRILQIPTKLEVSEAGMLIDDGFHRENCIHWRDSQVKWAEGER